MLSLGHRYPQQPHYIFVISRAATKFIARRFYQIFTQQPLDFGRFHTDTHTRAKFKIKRLEFQPAVFALTRDQSAGMKSGWCKPGRATNRLAGWFAADGIDLLEHSGVCGGCFRIKFRIICCASGFS